MIWRYNFHLVFWSFDPKLRVKLYPYRCVHVSSLPRPAASTKLCFSFSLVLDCLQLPTSTNKAVINYHGSLKLRREIDNKYDRLSITYYVPDALHPDLIYPPRKMTIFTVIL